DSGASCSPTTSRPPPRWTRWSTSPSAAAGPCTSRPPIDPSGGSATSGIPTATCGRSPTRPPGPGTSSANDPPTAPAPDEGVIVKIERDIAVPTRRGSHVSVDVFLPDGTGPWPVIATMSPYGKDVHWAERYPLYDEA